MNIVASEDARREVSDGDGLVDGRSGRRAHSRAQLPTSVWRTASRIGYEIVESYRTLRADLLSPLNNMTSSSHPELKPCL